MKVSVQTRSGSSAQQGSTAPSQVLDMAQLTARALAVVAPKPQQERDIPAVGQLKDAQQPVKSVERETRETQRIQGYLARIPTASLRVSEPVQDTRASPPALPQCKSLSEIKAEHMARKTHRDAAPVPPQVPTQTVRPTIDDAAPTPRMLPTYPNADDVVAGLRLSRQASKAWRLLHKLAVEVGKGRQYAVLPDQITFHCPQVSIATAIGYSAKNGGDNGARQLRNVIPELEAAGLIDTGSHAQNVLGQTKWDGSLWSVKMRHEAEPPRIRADEWKHNWRPGFTNDLLNKTGAIKEISELRAQEASSEEYYKAAKQRIAVCDSYFPPVVSSSEIPAPAGLRAVAERICGLWQHTNLRRRALEVGKLADAICIAFSEPERRRYWCKVLHDALAAQRDGRPGGLQAASDNFQRMASDIREGAPWRNAGAVMAARLRTKPPECP